MSEWHSISNLPIVQKGRPGKFFMTVEFDAGAALHIRRTGSLASLVRRELERMIEVGELRAGDRLNENVLAAKLGVSRGPVREACRGLEQSGLVEVMVNRGVFVRKLSDKAAAELYDIRAALMRLAGATLAPTITKWQVAELQMLIEKMEEAAVNEDLNRFFRSTFSSTMLSPNMAAMTA